MRTRLRTANVTLWKVIYTRLAASVGWEAA